MTFLDEVNSIPDKSLMKISDIDPKNAVDVTKIVYIAQYELIKGDSSKLDKLLKNTYISVMMPFIDGTTESNKLLKTIDDNNTEHFPENASKILNTDTTTSTTDDKAKIEFYKKFRTIYMLHTTSSNYKQNVLYKIMVLPDKGLPPEINQDPTYYTSEQFSKVLSLVLNTCFTDIMTTTNDTEYNKLMSAKTASINGSKAPDFIFGGGGSSKITKRKRKNIRPKKNSNTKKH